MINPNKDPLAEMIVSDDSDGEDSRSISDSRPLIEPQVNSQQSNVKRPELELKSLTTDIFINLAIKKKKSTSLGSGSK